MKPSASYLTGSVLCLHMNPTQDSSVKSTMCAWVCYALGTDVLLLQVKSTWDENLYTTRLDPTKIGISRDEADRLAREIEGSVAANRHLAEERNQSRDTGEEVSSPATFSSLPQFLILLLKFLHLMPMSFHNTRRSLIVVLTLCCV